MQQCGIKEETAHAQVNAVTQTHKYTLSQLACGEIEHTPVLNVCCVWLHDVDVHCRCRTEY